MISSKGNVTRDDSQGRFFAQHSFGMLIKQCCNHSKQCRSASNVVMRLCAKNLRCADRHRGTSPQLPEVSKQLLESLQLFALVAQRDKEHLVFFDRRRYF